MAKPLDRILREPEVLAQIGISRAQLWRLVSAGKFPARVRLTTRSMGWKQSEVQAWIKSRETVQA